MKAGRLGLLSVGLVFGLSACDILGGGGPAINRFAATPSSITAGQSSVLSWSVDSSATSVSISGVEAISGTSGSVTVTPTVTTEYTLTATNAEGSSTRDVTVTVTGGNGGSGGGNGGGTPTPPGGGTDGDGSFGVSTSATGPFSNDADGGISSDTDPRIISVAAGSTFYAEVVYEDPAGISDIAIQLVNDDPADLFDGPLPLGGFEVAGEPTGDCELGTATSVTCVYEITVAPGTQDISALPGANDEFAYVFRPLITNGAGVPVLLPIRGYVNIQ